MSKNIDVLIFSSDTTDSLDKYAAQGSRAVGGVVKLEDLEKNVAAMGPAINSIVALLKKKAKNQGLNEVIISLGINAKGKVGFFGTGGEIGGTATLSLKFDVSSDP